MGKWLALALLTACNLELRDEIEQPSLAETTQHAAVCADGPTVYGIDVSRFQGTIDWQPVKDSGVVYAWIQISRSVTDLDAKFDYNWRRAKEVGILRGAYQRFQPDQDVARQAEIFLDTLGPYEAGDMPPMLDVEDDGGRTPAQIAAAVQQWMDIVEPVVGVKPIIYTGYYFWKDKVAADFSEHPLWIANYSAECPLIPDTWSRWTFHQYSSSARIPGITENTVDVNKFNGTLEELKALGTPPVAPTCNPIDDANNIVDDASGCFRGGGPARFIRTEQVGHGGTLKWTHATESATAANFGEWQLTFVEGGRYRVEAHTPAPYNESKRAVYRVSHAGKTTDAMVDQSAVDGWNHVGEFEFAAGGMQSIRVDDNTGEASASDTMIVFDALRFTRVTPDGEPVVAEPGTVSDCHIAGGAAAWPLGALVLALRRRRRRR